MDYLLQEKNDWSECPDGATSKALEQNSKFYELFSRPYMYNCVQLRWDWKFYELSCLWPLLTSSTVGQMASQRVALPTNCSFSSDYTPLGRGRVQYEGNINSIFHRSAPVNSWPSSSISNVRVNVLSKTFIVGFIKICCVDHKDQSSSLVKSSAWRCKMPVDFLRILPRKNLVIAGGEPSCHFGQRPSSACEP